MESLKYMRLDERLEARSAITPEPLLGTWVNTNSATQGITKAVLTAKGNEIILQVFATGSPVPFDWGEAGAGPGVGPRNMPVQRGRVELCQDINAGDFRVDAVTDRNVDQAILGAQGHRGFRTQLG